MPGQIKQKNDGGLFNLINFFEHFLGLFQIAFAEGYNAKSNEKENDGFMKKAMKVSKHEATNV